MLKQQRMKPHKNNLIKMYLIFSYFFYLSDSFDVLEFKTKPKGSYGSAGNRVPIARGRPELAFGQNYRKLFSSLWHVDSLVRLGSMFD